MIFKETRIQSLSFAVRDSRFPHMCRAVPLSSSVFHTACALSAPSGHLPLEGKADDARIAFAQDDEMRRTTPLNLFCSIYRQYALNL